jgi:hypothetical protein
MKKYYYAKFNELAGIYESEQFRICIARFLDRDDRDHFLYMRRHDHHDNCAWRLYGRFRKVRECNKRDLWGLLTDSYVSAFVSCSSSDISVYVDLSK